MDDGTIFYIPMRKSISVLPSTKTTNTSSSSFITANCERIESNSYSALTYFPKKDDKKKKKMVEMVTVTQ